MQLARICCLLLCWACGAVARALKVRYVDAGPHARPVASLILLHGMTGDSGNGFHRFAQETVEEHPWLAVACNSRDYQILLNTGRLGFGRLGFGPIWDD